MRAGGKRKAGQRVEQPILYVAADGGDAPNRLASTLCGEAVTGDALLCAAEFREAEEIAGRLTPCPQLMECETHSTDSSTAYHQSSCDLR